LDVIKKRREEWRELEFEIGNLEVENDEDSD
jgi:hypothetical protein